MLGEHPEMVELDVDRARATALQVASDLVNYLVSRYSAIGFNHKQLMALKSIPFIPVVDMTRCVLPPIQYLGAPSFDAELRRGHSATVSGRSKKIKGGIRTKSSKADDANDWAFQLEQAAMELDRNHEVSYLTSEMAGEGRLNQGDSRRVRQQAFRTRLTAAAELIIAGFRDLLPTTSSRAGFAVGPYELRRLRDHDCFLAKDGWQAWTIGPIFVRVLDEAPVALVEPLSMRYGLGCS